jgi:hypothetical protein
MMQKRTIYLSLLLASLLLVFAFSFASAQSVSIQSKTNLPRCSDVVLNITVDNPDPLSAFEVILALNGPYTNLSVNFDGGLTVLTDRVLQVFGTPDTIRMAAMRLDAGDGCLPAGSTVIGQIHLKTGDVCSGTITVSGATVSGNTSCNCAVTASTGFVKCDPIEALAAAVLPGSVTIANQNPSITCPADTTVHWGDIVTKTITASDNDIANGCETLTFAIVSGPGSITKTDPTTATYNWTPSGDDICDHTVTIQVTDDCGASAECSFDICVTNDPPMITDDPADTIWATRDILLSGQVHADDPDDGPSELLYQLVSFDGPTYYGGGFNLNNSTGAWTWAIGLGDDYLGDFTLCVKVSDGSEICPPCNPTNADTICYAIRVIGFTVLVEKVHDVLQGHYITASIYVDSSLIFESPTPYLEAIGGFDFLIAYDPSALAFSSAAPGDLIDDGAFEYFTYRTGPWGNCGNGCPSGLVRIVGLREYNNGVTNPNHINLPGELVKLTFFVSNDRTLECQFVPIRFYWLDCGDNAISSEDGNMTYLGYKVFDFEGSEILDPTLFGYAGPADSCYDTVFTKDDSVKNYPYGVIIFRNGGIDIICSDSIDARGDVNLNGIANEIGDAVVFTNYFVAGLSAFTINPEGQIAATEINGDGAPLTVADLVYLVRIIIGDVSPLPKLAPDVKASFYANGSGVRVSTPVDIGAALFVFEGEVYPTLGPAASGMEIKYGRLDGNTRVLVYDLTGRNAITSGEVLTLSGHGSLIQVEAATFEGAVLPTNKVQAPTEFKLSQNYPNPFNPITAIDLALPTASNWTITVYNVSGQTVAEFSGYSEAGIVTVNWDASNLASGLYFYKATAGSFTATKKMVLLK